MSLSTSPKTLRYTLSIVPMPSIASFLTSRESLRQHNGLPREIASNLYGIWSLPVGRIRDLLSTCINEHNGKK